MRKHDRVDGSGMRKMLLLLAEHTDIIEVEGGKDICVFHDGWSDERVAEEMGHKNAGKIRTSRARYFGRLPDKQIEANDLTERVRICESQVHFWEKLEKLRPLIDDPEPTTPIKTNGHAKELN
mgnify:CR=1 FL=1